MFEKKNDELLQSQPRNSVTTSETPWRSHESYTAPSQTLVRVKAEDNEDCS